MFQSYCSVSVCACCNISVSIIPHIRLPMRINPPLRSGRFRDGGRDVQVDLTNLKLTVSIAAGEADKVSPSGFGRRSKLQRRDCLVRSQRPQCYRGAQPTNVPGEAFFASAQDVICFPMCVNPPRRGLRGLSERFRHRSWGTCQSHNCGGDSLSLALD